MNERIKLYLEAVDKISKPMKEMQKRFGSTMTSAQKMQKKFGNTQGQLEQIKQFRALTDSTAKHNQMVKKAQEQLAKITIKQKSSGKTTAAMTERIRAQQAKVKSLTRVQKEYVQNINKMNNRLSKAGINVKRLSQEESKLNKVLSKQGQQLTKLHRRQQRFNRLRQQAARIMPKLNMMGLISGAGIGVGVGLTARQVNKDAEAIDKLGKKSAILKIAVNNLQAYEHSAQLNGVADGVLTKSLSQMSKRIGELKANTGSMFTYLNKLDKPFLNQLQSVKDNDQAFELLSERIAKIKDPTEQAALANAAFGRSGQDLLLMLRRGSEGLAHAKKQIAELGATLTQEDIKAAADYNDEMLNVGRSFEMAKFKFTLELMKKITPYFTQITEKLKDPIWRNKALDKFRKILDNIEKIIPKVWEGMKFLGSGLVSLINHFDKIIFALGVFKVAMLVAFRTNPIGAFFSAIQGIVIISAIVYKNFEKIKASISSIATGIWETLISPFQFFLNLLNKMPLDWISEDLAKTIDGWTKSFNEYQRGDHDKLGENKNSKTEITLNLKGAPATVEKIESDKNQPIIINRPVDYGEMGYLVP